MTEHVGPEHIGPRHIGISACSAEGAALCYRTICAEGAESLGSYAHPEVTLLSKPYGIGELQRHLAEVEASLSRKRGS